MNGKYRIQKRVEGSKQSCWLPAVVILLLMAGCNRDGGRMTTDRVHDLVALMDGAEYEVGNAYTLQYAVSLTEEENRDGLAFFRASPKAPVTFRRLFTRGKATLTFGCGLAFKEVGPDTGAALFRVEMRNDLGQSDTPGQEPPMELLFEERFAPADFPARDRYKIFQRDLPGAGDGAWTLRFSCAPAEGGAEPLDWAAWIAPRLESQGREIALQERPVERIALHKDLMEEFDSAIILEQAEGRPPAPGMLDAAKGILIMGGNRKTIRAHAPSRIRYRVTPARDSVFNFTYGMDSETGWMLPGDGMTFAVALNDKEVWSETVKPHERELDKGWKTGSIDLDPWAGQEITLDLITRTGADPSHDMGGWAAPVILQSETVKRLSSKEAPTVIVVVVETLRADRLGVYGGSNDLTPRIDAFARHGRVYRGAHSTSSWTWPSIGSILTGHYPDRHGVQDKFRCFLSRKMETLPELFMDRGYTTGAFIGNLIISRDNNFDKGFETYVYTPSATARAMNERVLHWLDNTAGTARFAFIHYYDPHMPYKAPDAFPPRFKERASGLTEEELAERLGAMYQEGTVDPDLRKEYLDIQRAKYDAEVAYLDTAFGELLDALEARGLFENSIVVLTSDHGEEFGEHDKLAHGPHLYEETVQVPLIMRGYGESRFDAATIFDPVETKEILPTLCDLLDMPLPAEPVPGGSLLTTKSRALFAQTLIGHEPGIEGQTEKLSITRGEWKLIFTPASGRIELYNLAEDGAEKMDRAQEMASLSKELKKILLLWQEHNLALAPESVVADPEEMEKRLKALGYTGE